MLSACVYEKMCPRWRCPETVGGGVSMEKTGAGLAGSKAWHRSRSQRAWAAGSIDFGSYGASRGEAGGGGARVYPSSTGLLRACRRARTFSSPMAASTRSVYDSIVSSSRCSTCSTSPISLSRA